MWHPNDNSDPNTKSNPNGLTPMLIPILNRNPTNPKLMVS